MRLIAAWCQAHVLIPDAPMGPFCKWFWSGLNRYSYLNTGSQQGICSTRGYIQMLTTFGLSDSLMICLEELLLITQEPVSHD